MKKVLLILLTLLASFTNLAAQSTSNDVQKRLNEVVANEVVIELQLDAKQQKKFLPVYMSYCKEMQSIGGHKHEFDKHGKDQKQGTSDQSKKIEKEKKDHKQQIHEIRAKYYKKFAKIFTADQMKRFHDVEKEINHKVFRRKEASEKGKGHGHGEHGKGHGHGEHGKGHGEHGGHGGHVNGHGNAHVMVTVMDMAMDMAMDTDINLK